MTMLMTGIAGEYNTFPYYSSFTARWNPELEPAPTTVDGAISSLPDITGNGNNATQGTAANRPLLSRSDNRENYLLQSELRNNAAWTKTGLTSVTDSVGVTPSGNSYSTLLIDTSTGLHRILQTPYVISSRRSSVEFRAGQSDVQLFFEIQSVTGFYVNADGTVINSFGESNRTIEVTALGDDWFRITFEKLTGVSTNLGWRLYIAKGSATSFTGNGTDTIQVAAPFFHPTTADNTYVATTTYPQYAGINGNSVAVFDGSNDSLTTAIAVNPTGGFAGGVVVKANLLHTGIPMAAYNGGATDRMQFILLNTGAIIARALNGSSNYIGRQTPSSSYSANTTTIFTWTYDGGTLASGIKIYKNGVQIDNANDNAGSYTVGTAGRILEIGSQISGTSAWFYGSIAESIFINAGTWSDADRQAWEQWAIRFYGI